MTRAGAAWLALVCGAGCMAPDDVPPVEDVSLLRNPTAHIGSQVDVTASDLAGPWVVRQTVVGAWPAPSSTVTFTANGSDLGLRVLPQICAGSDVQDCDPNQVTAIYEAGLSGRYALSAPPVGEGPLPSEIWVYWMDFDDRTVAIGNPNGGFVAILDRSATGGSDRIVAARDILDWYGYDVSKLVRGE